LKSDIKVQNQQTGQANLATKDLCIFVTSIKNFLN
jgi:hypothetical protein